jgi:hypothetical protein
MSTDYVFVCDATREIVTAGKVSAHGYSSIGAGDPRVAKWVYDHVQEHGSVRVVVLGTLEGEYARPEWDW